MRVCCVCGFVCVCVRVVPALSMHYIRLSVPLLRYAYRKILYSRGVDGCDRPRAAPFASEPRFSFGSGERFDMSTYQPQDPAGNVRRPPHSMLVWFV